MRVVRDEANGSNQSPNALATLFSRFAKCDAGATAIEYGLIAGMIFVVIVASVQGVATQTTAMHQKIQDATR